MVKNIKDGSILYFGILPNSIRSSKGQQCLCSQKLKDENTFKLWLIFFEIETVILRGSGITIVKRPQISDALEAATIPNSLMEAENSGALVVVSNKTQKYPILIKFSKRKL